jgi:hypothetical protein
MSGLITQKDDVHAVIAPDKNLDQIVGAEPNLSKGDFAPLLFCLNIPVRGSFD